MKKSVAAYWAFAVSLVLVTFVMTAEAKAQLLDRNLSLRDLANQLQTPEDIAHYMWRHFSFESDQAQFGKEEYWQSPDEFLSTQKGDCEDFALFAHEILKMNGVKSYLVNIYSDRFAHTVCVFKEGDKWNVIDGTRVMRFKSDNLQELSSKIYPFWNKGAIVTPSVNSDHARILSKYARTAKAHRQFAASL